MIIGKYYISFTKHAKLPWNRLKVGKIRSKPWSKPYASHVGWGRFSLWIEKDTCGCRWSEDCQECCEHGDIDAYCCLDCGKDLTEDRMAAAYDAYKDSYKYGD